MLSQSRSILLGLTLAAQSALGANHLSHGPADDVQAQAGRLLSAQAAPAASYHRPSAGRLHRCQQPTIRRAGAGGARHGRIFSFRQGEITDLALTTMLSPIL